MHALNRAHRIEVTTIGGARQDFRRVHQFVRRGIIGKHHARVRAAFGEGRRGVHRAGQIVGDDCDLERRRHG